MKNFTIKMRNAALIAVLLLTGIINSGAQWVQTNGPNGGGVSCAAISGNNLLANSLISTDSGATWSDTGYNFNLYFVDGNNIYATDGNNNGLYLSTNNGLTWFQVSTNIPLGVFDKVAADGNKIIVCESDFRICLSTNNGVTWNSCNISVYNYFTAIAIKGNNIYAGFDIGGLYISKDNGNTSYQTSLPSPDVSSIALDGANIFVGTKSGVYLSTDNCATWTAVNTGLTNTVVTKLAISGGNLYAGTDGGGVFLSTNNGSSWTAVNTGLTCYKITALAANGNKVLAGTPNVAGGGVFYSTNNGGNWNITGLINTTVNTISVKGSDIFAGTNLGMYLTGNGGSSWFPINNGLANSSVNATAAIGSNIFAGTFAGVFLSTDNGNTFTAVNTGLSNLSVYSLAVSGNNIYAGTAGGNVFVSSNNGGNWTDINDYVPNTPIRSLAILGTTIIAGTGNDGVYISANNGASWTNTGLTGESVVSLTVNGTNIFAGTGTGLYLSTDIGNSWKAFTTAFTNVYSLVFSGTNIFAGTSGGTYISPDNGANWAAIDSGGKIVSKTLAIDATHIYAGTAGTGVWKYPLAAIPFHHISGTVFNDYNNNGIKDNGEPGLSKMLITSKADNFYSGTDSTGRYSIYSLTVNDTVKVVAQSSPYAAITPAYYYISQSDSAKDFAIHFIPGIHDLRVTVTGLTASRPGFDDILRITYANTGTDTMNGYLSFDFDNLLTLLSCNPPQSALNGNTITWNYSALMPLESRNIDVKFNIPPTVPINDSLNFSASVFPVANDVAPADNSNSLAQIVTGSFDPNEKEVFPVNGLTPQMIAAGEELVFTIHFQNTGNDTAFNIKLTDTLSANLDAGTFEMLSSSHPCTFTMRGAGVVEFYFQNIMLPDSNVNLTGSNGFVKYSVKPKAAVQIGDSITNEAYIFFDFNKPIVTNTTSTPVKLIIGLNDDITAGNRMLVYPNPASEVLCVEIQSPKSQIPNSKEGRYFIYDGFGQLISAGEIKNEETKINVSALAKGLYLLKIENENGVAVKRFIKE